MAGWTTCEGTAVALWRENIDTDQLIPARFMSVPRSEGYGSYLMHDLRRDDEGALLAGFPLNVVPDPKILIADRNFGSGSSREAAVYALVDAGIQAIIAPSFGDIFAGNAVNNGLLPARVRAETFERLKGSVAGNSCALKIDLSTGQIEVDGQSLPFELQNAWRTKLINGWDDIDLTLQHADAISDYKTARKTTAAWSWPVQGQRNEG